jgi:heme/copper-type cytochrome/quinol oxidase subunit 2
MSARQRLSTVGDPPRLGQTMGVSSVLFWDLWGQFVWWSVLVAVIVFVWMMHHSLVYRSKEGEELPNPDEIEVGVFPKEYHNFTLEITWTVIPLILILYLTFVAWAPLNAVWAPTGEADVDDSLKIYGSECTDGQSSYFDSVNTTANCYHKFEIVGYQWYWEFNCLELDSSLCATGFTSIAINETTEQLKPVLTLKSNEVYLVEMTSKSLGPDSPAVTHAPWFIDIGTKEDVVPNEITTLWLTPTTLGSTLILCTEYCGQDHAYMIAQIDVIV